ncbi:hypothetical protein BDW22DRAFT_1407075 [Trametopsis cervina]|nr:hypothetical protein BDW22DRAFT_1407075 [Trametopsis cervina]
MPLSSAVYAYAPDADNEAQTQYIFMEYRCVHAVGVGERDIAVVLGELVKLETRMMEIEFPAGSLYYAEDLEKVGGGAGVPLGNASEFCVGPDVRLHMWYGRRAQLEVDREPYLQPSNIIVTPPSASSDLKILSLLDWQHASILPLFLHANIPGRLQNHADPVSHALIPPTLPSNIEELGRIRAERREYNKHHHAALTDPVALLAFRLFTKAGAPWEGETHALQTTLIEVTEHWSTLPRSDAPCPIAFAPSDVLTTRGWTGCRAIIGFESEMWVPTENYEMASNIGELLKLRLLMALEDRELRANFERIGSWMMWTRVITCSECRSARRRAYFT